MVHVPDSSSSIAAEIHVVLVFSPINLYEEGNMLMPFTSKEMNLIYQWHLIHSLAAYI